MGNGAMGNGAMGDSAMGNNAMGNGAMGNGAMGNGAMGDSAMRDDETLGREMLALLAMRDATASVCPSEVARKVAPDAWRDLMPRVRTVAAALAAQGLVRITQGDSELRPDDVARGAVRGPIRLRQGATSVPTAGTNAT